MPNITESDKYEESLLESIDAFGHVIEFSLKGRDGNYKTKVGGFVTMLLNCLIA
jgi:hypothetical protein